MKINENLSLKLDFYQNYESKVQIDVEAADFFEETAPKRKNKLYWASTSVKRRTKSTFNDEKR